MERKNSKNASDADENIVTNNQSEEKGNPLLFQSYELLS